VPALRALLGAVDVVEYIFKVHLVDISLLLHWVALTLCTLGVDVVHLGGPIAGTARLNFVLLTTARSDTVKVALLASKTEANFHISIVLFSHWEAVSVLSRLFQPWVLKHLRNRNPVSWLYPKHTRDQIFGIIRDWHRVTDVSLENKGM